MGASTTGIRTRLPQYSLCERVEDRRCVVRGVANFQLERAKILYRYNYVHGFYGGIHRQRLESRGRLEDEDHHSSLEHNPESTRNRYSPEGLVLHFVFLPQRCINIYISYNT